MQSLHTGKNNTLTYIIVLTSVFIGDSIQITLIRVEWIVRHSNYCPQIYVSFIDNIF